jgi:hypothetical protein
MKYILSIAFALGLTTAFGQNYIQWTIKAGAQSSQVDVYLRPNFNFNPGLTPFVYFGQVQFAIGWSTSCPVGAQPTVSFTIDPSFNTNGGGTYSSAVFPQSTSISPAGETYNVISLNRVGSGAQSFPSGVEVKVGTVTMSGSAPACTIKIVDYADAGNDGQASCYATNSATGDYLVAPTSDGNFYTSPGNSLAGGNATSGYSQVVQGISLPLKLISFTGTVSNCNTTLSWITAEEINFSHFEIEESTDGTVFTKTGMVKATGGAGQIKYSFAAGTISGNHCYRLRMVDNDGKAMYSYVRAINGNCADAASFNVYPNPLRVADQALGIRFINVKGGAVQVNLYNEAGQQAMSKRLTATAGINVQQLQLPVLSAGSYYLKLTDKDGKEIGARQLIIK